MEADDKGPAPIEQMGVWLSAAWLHFGNPSIKKDCLAAAAEFHRLGEGETVESAFLNDDVSTENLKDHYKGDQLTAFRLYRRFKEILENDLIRQLYSGNLRAFGYPQVNGGTRGYQATWIPFLAWWDDLKRDANGGDIARGEGIVWRYIRVVTTATAEAPDIHLEGALLGASESGLLEWMTNHLQAAVDAGGKAKRDGAIKDCMTAAKCSYRDGRKAWNAAPSDLKRSPRETDRILTGR